MTPSKESMALARELMMEHLLKIHRIEYPATVEEALALAFDRIREEEREACAKVAEFFEPDEKSDDVRYASQAIRTRNTQKGTP